MLSRSSMVALGLGSEPSCSTPVQVQANPFSALHLLPRRSSLLPPLSQEDFFESFDGSFYDVNDIFGADSFECDCSVPDSQLIKRIVSQVEFYLSDENLAKDAFLLKHVQKNKMGFVSIKLLTSFKKVKYLTRDWRLTLYALHFSELLEVNEEGTKVRRRNPIPESLLSIPPSKLLLAWNRLPHEQALSLPLQKSFIETITKMFSPFGAITSIRILRPGKKLPSDVKKYSFRYPELLTKCCALVEYESLENARKAYEELNHSQGSLGIKVVRLSGKGSKKKSGAEQEEEVELAGKPGWKPQASPASEKMPCSTGDSFFCSSSESDSTPTSPPVLMQQYLSSPAWPASSLCSLGASFKPCFFSTPYSSPLLSGKALQCPSSLAAELGNGGPSSLSASPEYHRFSDSCWDSGIGSGSSWVQRRRAAAQSPPLETKPLLCSPLAARKVPDSFGLRPGVIRLPHGPDGTKGFYSSIGRGKLVLRH
ncbi:PREDICTED: la-related protein 6-like [Gavialis gangeticus]|uniref:la-related protein 6-like n=1 Tax=Gavialis gangeticus TaxID=94835 RepID=UPI00092F865F|nr:PREDICTED: la-related protein 6-like [Gavialis gangeticus]